MIGNVILNFYLKISIKTKLVLGIIILVIYPVLIGYFGYVSYTDSIRQKSINYSQKSSLEITTLLNDHIDRLNAFTYQILYDNRIYDAERYFSQKDNDPYSVSIFQNDFQSYLQTILFSKSEISEILINFSRSKKLCQTSRTLVENTDSYFLKDKLYKAAKTSKSKSVWYIDSAKGKLKGIYLAKILYDVHSMNTEIGLLVFKLDNDYLFEILNSMIAKSDQDVTLFGQEGTILYNYDAFPEKFTGTISSEIKTVPDNKVKIIKSGNDRRYLIVNTINPLNWKLVTIISTNVLLKDIRNTSSIILILVLVSIPVWLILINVIYNDIVKPINHLVKNMRKIEKGEIGVTIGKSRNDEFGYLFKTFNNMSQQIKNLINTVYRKQIAVKDAEIKALQAQINPHFLYNTLDSINWKAKINGVDEISEMVSALSSIIDANLSRKNDNLILLQKEIEYINNYFLLIKKRFGQKIKLETSIAENTLKCIIPKLIIQPIIENSLHHGLETKIGEGTIKLGIYKCENKLIVTVLDDGVGIDILTLNDIKKDISVDVNADAEEKILSSTNIGIINVYKRIKLIYGDEYGLEIDSKYGEGTSVTLTLPYITIEGDNENV